jgi:hypothetical protein
VAAVAADDLPVAATETWGVVTVATDELPEISSSTKIGTTAELLGH